MKVEETILKDCFIIRDNMYGDERGYFFESYNQQHFNQQTGLDITFVQDNQSKSKRGVLRGLHFQMGQFAQAKLIRVLQGRVLDVAVDVRPTSPTFGQHVAIELTAENNIQFFIPRGFAHGFIVLSEEAVFFYKCDNVYNKQSEGGIMYNDASLNIDWQVDASEIILSDKDKTNPLLSDIKDGLVFN